MMWVLIDISLGDTILLNYYAIFCLIRSIPFVLLCYLGTTKWNQERQVSLFPVVSHNVKLCFLQAVMGFQNLLPPECVVIREGCEQTLCSEELVVGDLIKIKTGMRIPADCRILAANQLKLESSSITGEAEPHGLALKLASFISK